MKPETAKVWNVIKKNLDGFWHRVENTVWPGTPDTDFIIDGVAGKVELKYLDAWPVNEKTRTDLGIEKAQRVFLKQYAANRGRGYILARVNKDWLLIPGGADLSPADKQTWVGRAIYYEQEALDYKTLMVCLTYDVAELY